MLCDKIRDNLSAYIDGEAGPQLTAEIERHLNECDSCRAELAQLRKVAGLLSAMPQHGAPLTLAEDVQGRLERQMLMDPGNEPEPALLHADRRLPQRRPSAWPRVAAVAACLVLVAGITALLTPLGVRKTESRMGAQADKGIATGGDVTDDNGIGWGSAPTAIARSDEDKLELGKSIASANGAMHRSIRSESVRSRSKTGDDFAYDEGAEGLRRIAGKSAADASFYSAEIARKDAMEGRRLEGGRVSRDATQTIAMASNGLFLMASDAESGEQAVLEALVQAGVANVKMNRSQVRPVAWTIEESAQSGRRSQMGLAAGQAKPEAEAELLEVVTIEARVNPAQAATLNFVVANNDALIVSEQSNGVFAQTAQTQQLMRQVPLVERNRQLAANTIVQYNLRGQQADVEEQVARAPQGSTFQWKDTDSDDDKYEKSRGSGVTVAKGDGPAAAPPAAGPAKAGETRDAETPTGGTAGDVAPAKVAESPASAMRPVDLATRDETVAPQRAPQAEPESHGQAAQRETATEDEKKAQDAGERRTYAFRLADVPPAPVTTPADTPSPAEEPSPAGAPGSTEAPQVRTNDGAAAEDDRGRARQLAEATESPPQPVAQAMPEAAPEAAQEEINKELQVMRGVTVLGGMARQPAAPAVEDGADDRADEALLPIVIQLVARRGPSQAAAAQQAVPPGAEIHAYDAIMDLSRKTATDTAGADTESGAAETRAAPSPPPQPDSSDEPPAQR
jgi:hypothetical protein